MVASVTYGTKWFSLTNVPEGTAIEVVNATADDLPVKSELTNAEIVARIMDSRR